MRVAVVVSGYHRDITHSMRDAAVRKFVDCGGSTDAARVVAAPGAFERTPIALACARRDDVDAVIALGCIITGETAHDEYIAAAVANGLTEVMLKTGKPVAFGVLTCRTIEQAVARSGGRLGNKGEDAMVAALETTSTLRAIGDAGA